MVCSLNNIVPISLRTREYLRTSLPFRVMDLATMNRNAHSNALNSAVRFALGTPEVIALIADQMSSMNTLGLVTLSVSIVSRLHSNASCALASMVATCAPNALLEPRLRSGAEVAAEAASALAVSSWCGKDKALV